MSYKSSEDFAQEVGRFRRWVSGMLRRMQFTIIDGRFFQLLGQRDGTGGPEVVRAEPFTGFGFFGVPPSSGDPVVIMAGVGGSNDPVVIATQDEPTRAAAVDDAGDAPGTQIVYNDKALIVITPSGGVEIRLLGGVAVKLATLKDLQDLSDAFTNWTPAPSDGGAALKTKITALQTGGWPVGTSVLKAQ